jgi:serine protease Do
MSVAALMSSGASVSAQTPTPQAPVASTVGQTPPVSPQAEPEKIRPRTPRRASTPPARVTVIADEAVAPQVVTIVHRLSGVKMLRFLLRQGGERGTLYTIDPMAITSDAHATIIAGWALDDGRTIAARLPQAAAEIEFSNFAFPPAELEQLGSPAASVRRPMMLPRSQPDLTVITRDGKRVAARYIGLDGQTGLSVLQLTGVALRAQTEVLIKKIVEGQRVQLFAPERTTPTGAETPGSIYVRVGETDAKVSKLASTNSERPERLTVRAAKLTPVVIGGIACDESGNTLGIVEAIEGNDARIVSAETIRAAARRVIARQASVPRPLLGVRGEPLDPQSRASLLANGWREDQLPGLFEKQIGILLTTVMPGTPAAFAKLRAGDVIVRVNEEDIKSAEEFSHLLTQAGSGEQVNFIVRRPGSTAPVAVEVTLGGSFEPFEYRFEMPAFAFPQGWHGLEGLGIQTVALTARVASQLGAQGGLLVVAVQPDSAAARSGVREGDVIESIDGRVARAGARVFMLARQKKHLVSVVRDREKKQLVVETIEQ